ncbi:MAG: glycosyltransferase family 39 protein [Armatimonadota bacterium]
MDSSVQSAVDERVGTSSIRRVYSDRWLFALFAVLALAAVLRIYQLGTENMWIDEGLSLKDASAGFTVQKASRPLYFWILSPWMHLGQSDWLLRVPSVIFDLVTVAVIFLLARKIWGMKAAVVAGLLIAVSPLHVDHSQEVRMYTLLALTGIGTFYFFVNALKSGRTIYIVGCVVCFLMALLTHAVAIVLLVPMNLIVFWTYRRDWKRLLPWVVFELVVLAIWFPRWPYVASFGTGYSSQAYLDQMYKPKLFDIPVIWGKFGISEWGGGGRLINALCYVYTVGAALLLAYLVWADRKRPETKWAAVWLLAPTVAVFLMSVVDVNIWVIRYLMFISPIYFLLLGAAVSRFRNKTVFAVLCLFLLIPAAGKLARYYLITNRPQWKLAVEYIKERERPSDTIAIYRHSVGNIFDHYYDGKSKWHAVWSEDFLKDRTAEFDPWNEEKAIKLIETMPAEKRQWLVLSRLPRKSMEYIKPAIKSRCRVLASREFKEISVYLLERPVSPSAKTAVGYP